MSTSHDARWLMFAAVGREDSPARVRLLARLAAALRDERLRERRLALAVEAVEMARRIGDPETLAYALDGCFTAVEGPDNISERLAGLEELIALGEQIGDKERVYVGHDYRLHTFWTLGDRRRRPRARQPRRACRRASPARPTVARERFANGARADGRALRLSRRADRGGGGQRPAGPELERGRLAAAPAGRSGAPSEAFVELASVDALPRKVWS